MTVETLIEQLKNEYAKKIDLTLDQKLKIAMQLQTKGDKLKAINKIIECYEIARKNAIELELLQTLYFSREIYGSFDEEILYYKKFHADLLIKSAKLMLNVVGIDEDQKGWECVHASLKNYEILEKMPEDNRIAYRSTPGRTFSTNESPFYTIKYLLRTGISIFDERSADLLAKNDFKNAFVYLNIVGELFLHEIYLAINIKDDFLYSKEDIGILFYNAGEAFLRAFHVIKDKFLSMEMTRPLFPPFLLNVTGKLFQTRNVQLSSE